MDLKKESNMGRAKVTKKKKRRPHSIAFSKIEWDLISRAANLQYLRPSTFIRMAALELANKNLSKK